MMIAISCEQPLPTPIPTPTPALTRHERAELELGRVAGDIRRLAESSSTVQFIAPSAMDYWKGCQAIMLQSKGLPPYDWGLTIRDEMYGLLIMQGAGIDWQDLCRVRHRAEGEWANIGSGKWDILIR